MDVDEPMGGDNVDDPMDVDEEKNKKTKRTRNPKKEPKKKKPKIKSGKPRDSSGDFYHENEDLLGVLPHIEQHDSMMEALLEKIRAIPLEKFIHSSSIDVKVAFLACISEIMRICVPDIPFENQQMKDVFKSMTTSCRNICTEKPQGTICELKKKITAIFVTMTKIKYFPLMWDWEDVKDMFLLFLNDISDDDLEDIFESVSTIMLGIMTYCPSRKEFYLMVDIMHVLAGKNMSEDVFERNKSEIRNCRSLKCHVDKTTKTKLAEKLVGFCMEKWELDDDCLKRLKLLLKGVEGVE